MSKLSDNDIMQQYVLIDRLSDRQLEQLHGLYQHEWWSTHRTMGDTKKIIKNSSMIFGIVDQQDSLVAFCRVLTDSCFFAYIYDVIVKPDHRNQGLGNMLLQSVLAHPDLSKLNSMELVCRKDMAEYYQQYGFSTDYGQSVAMRLKSDDGCF
jgi:predicted GNAT family N-acyltransferase